MGVIAKGEITLSPVNDAYTVSLTPSSIVINADFDGTNPRLENANATLTVKKGSSPVLFEITSISTTSGILLANLPNPGVAQYQYNLAFLTIPTDVLYGNVEIEIVTADDAQYTATVNFAYTVNRAASMIDWILDWDGSKTKIGGTYIMTPKLFVGNKDNVTESIDDEDGTRTEWVRDSITGVYIGPDLLSDQETFSVGLYGYRNSQEIFHLNEEGGLIGGWEIEEGGIQTTDGLLKILSEGSIEVKDGSTTIWQINKNGEAVFSKGNVSFHADGSAEFAGSITALDGYIAGWEITPNHLHNGPIYISSKEKIFGIITGQSVQSDDDENVINIKASVENGGIMMYHTSGSDYGLACYLSENKIFSLGSSNFIAGWSFNKSALFRGQVKNEGNLFTESSGDLTIGTEGIRGYKWRIDSNGTAAFSGANVVFNETDGILFGWNLSTTRLSTAHVSLVSDSNRGGLYLTPFDITNVATGALPNLIESNGGIYINSNATEVTMKSIDCNGNTTLVLQSSGENSIGAWNFNSHSIYHGTEQSSGFTGNGEITLGLEGIRGHKWRFEADGSGALANGKIVWNTDGSFVIGEANGLSYIKYSLTDGLEIKAKLNILSSIGNDPIPTFMSNAYQTVIDGGVITSGMVKLVGNEGVVEAGIKGCGGDGDDGNLRIWVGADYEHRDEAPFRINKDGELIAENATITGGFYGFTRRKPVVINNENIEYYTEETAVGYRKLLFNRTGRYIVVDGVGLEIALPSLFQSENTPSSIITEARSLVDQSVCIEAHNGASVVITNVITNILTGSNPQTTAVITEPTMIRTGEFGEFKCQHGVMSQLDSTGYLQTDLPMTEYIGWDGVVGLLFETTGGIEIPDTPIVPDTQIPAEPSITPSSAFMEAYEEVEFIESSGTQYIELPTHFTVGNFYRVQYTKIDDTACAVFGAKTDGSINPRNGNFVFNAGIDVTGMTNKPTFDCWERLTSSEEAMKVEAVVCATKCIVKDSSTDTTILEASGDKKVGGSKNLYLFGCNGPSGFSNGGNIRISRFMIQSANGDCLMYLVPARLMSDPSIVGMYDLVSDAFYTNSGNGSFRSGHAQ